MQSIVAHKLRVFYNVAVSSLGTFLAMLPNDGPFCRMRLRYWQARGFALGHDCVVFGNVLLLGKITIGPYSSISNNCSLNGSQAGIEIGHHVMIGPGCTLVAFNHGFRDLQTPMIDQPLEEAPIVIGDDVWIGANCTITAGVRIGSGSIVGANSAVTKDVPPFGIVGGVPAKLLTSRKNSHPERVSNGE